jgi:excisionase family DNA binding protein
MAKRVLTSFESARYCGVSPYTIRNWVEAGRLPAYATPGGHRRIRREDLDAFMQAHGIPSPEDFAGGCKRVLVVESAGEPLSRLRRFVGQLSEKLEVRGASEGFEVAWRILTFRPHALFLSLDLPRLGGMRVLARLKSSPETSACHVIAMTSRPEVDTVKAVLDAGAIECLVKPLDWDAVGRILRGLFPSSVPARPRSRKRPAKG